MKKLIAFLLAMTLALSCAACQDTSPAPSADADTALTPDEKPEKENVPSFEPREFQKTATIEETVLYDENDIRIAATDLTYGSYSAELHLTIENNSDKELSFVANSIGYSCNAVNGYMVADGYVNCDVAVGKKANETVSISYENLMILGIYEIADLEVGFSISDNDYNYLYTGPCKILTSAADGYDYTTPHYRENIASAASQYEYGYTVPYFSTETVYESSGLSVVSQAVIVNADEEYMLLLEVVNGTDQAVKFSTSNIDLNGLRVCDSTWSYDAINPGNTSIVDVNLSSVLEPEYWDPCGISEIGSVALDMVFTDEEGDNITAPAKLTVQLPNAEAAFSMDGTEVYHKDGIRLISKGVLETPSEYSDEMHILLLAENTSDKTVTLHNVYNSLSVNDYMTSYSLSSVALESGSCTIVEITLWGYGLEDLAITAVDQITSVEFSISFKNESYKELDTATICLDLS